FVEKLNAEDRELTARSGDTHEAGATHLRMGIEDGLHHQREEEPAGSPPPVLHPSNDPKTTPFLEVARVAQPVPSIDLVLPVARWIIEVAGAQVRAAHQDLADLSGGQLLEAVSGPFLKLRDAQLDALEGPTHAESPALLGHRPRLGQGLPGAVSGGGECLGRAVVRV